MSESSSNYSTSTHLKLVKVDATSFAGLNAPDNDPSLVITFPEVEDNAMIIEGDQGVGKTSLLECLKFIFTGDEPVNAINSISKNKKVTAIFKEKDTDKHFIVKVTKTGYEIQKVETVNGKEEKSKIQSPKNWLREKIGPVGVDPSFLRSMSAEQQMQYIGSLFKNSGEIAATQRIINEEIKKVARDRKNEGRNLRSAKTRLISSSYFRINIKDKKKIEPTEKFKNDSVKFKEDIAEKQSSVKLAYQTATERKSKKERLANNINTISQSFLALDKEIYDLEKLLEEKKATRVQDMKIVETYTKDLNEFGDVEEQFKNATEALDNLNNYVVEKNNFSQIERELELFNTLSDNRENFNSQISDREAAKARLVQEINPDIPGLELCVSQDVDIEDEMEIWKDDHEEATPGEELAYKLQLGNKNRNGIFYNGMPVNQLCESELWSICTHIWKHQNVPVIFIENYSSLGSDAIATLNQFLGNGGQIFATLMNRELKNMKISFNTNLE